MEKLCVFCEHLQYNVAETGDYADPADLQCKKGHGLHPKRESRGQFVYDIEDFRVMILTAQNCPDYTPPNV